MTRPLMYPSTRHLERLRGPPLPRAAHREPPEGRWVKPGQQIHRLTESDQEPLASIHAALTSTNRQCPGHHWDLAQTRREPPWCFHPFSPPGLLLRTPGQSSVVL